MGILSKEERKMRELWRQGKLSRKIKCLKCCEYFISESAAIRICNKCKSNKDNYNPSYQYYGNNRGIL